MSRYSNRCLIKSIYLVSEEYLGATVISLLRHYVCVLSSYTYLPYLGSYMKP